MARWCSRPCAPARPAAASPSGPDEGVGTVTRAGPPRPAGRARDQSGAAPDDPRCDRRGRDGGERRGRRRGRDRHPGRRGAGGEDAQPRGSASSAACRSSAPPASSCPIPARRGSTRSISGIDVARAAGLTLVAGVDRQHLRGGGAEAPRSARDALIDMGDFVGGMLKYLRTHPVPRVTIAGGVGKMTKLAQGLLDLHSERGTVDLAALARASRRRPAAPPRCASASWRRTRRRRRSRTPPRKASRSAMRWRGPRRRTAMGVVEGRGIAIEIVLFDRDGRLVGHAPFATSS